MARRRFATPYHNLKTRAQSHCHQSSKKYCHAQAPRIWSKKRASGWTAMTSAKSTERGEQQHVTQWTCYRQANAASSSKNSLMKTSAGTRHHSNLSQVSFANWMKNCIANAGWRRSLWVNFDADKLCGRIADGRITRSLRPMPCIGRETSVRRSAYWRTQPMHLLPRSAGCSGIP